MRRLPGLRFDFLQKLGYKSRWLRNALFHMSFGDRSNLPPRVVFCSPYLYIIGGYPFYFQCPLDGAAFCGRLVEFAVVARKFGIGAN